jgi:uncharacterized protein (UPF0335 family)
MTEPTTSKRGSSKDDLIIVDLGSRSRKSIDRLRQGKGKLMGDIDEVIGELKAAGGVPASAQPIVIVVTEKLDKKMRIPMPPFFPMPG